MSTHSTRCCLDSSRGGQEVDSESEGSTILELLEEGWTQCLEGGIPLYCNLIDPNIGMPQTGLNLTFIFKIFNYFIHFG